MPTALAKINETIVRFSHDDRDLAKKDFAFAKVWCFQNHCERVWAKLSADERDALRDMVREDGPASFSTALYIDYSCIEEIGRLIADEGCYPFSDGVPVVDTVK